MRGQFSHRRIDYSIVAVWRIHVANGVGCDTHRATIRDLFVFLERFATASYLLIYVVEDEG